MADREELHRVFAEAYDFLESARGHMSLIADGELVGIEVAGYFFEEMTEQLTSLQSAVGDEDTGANGTVASVCEELRYRLPTLVELSEEAAWNSNYAELLNNTDVAREFYSAMMMICEKLEEGMDATDGDSPEEGLSMLENELDTLNSLAVAVFRGEMASAEELGGSCGEHRLAIGQARAKLGEAGVSMEAYDGLFEKIEVALQRAGEDGSVDAIDAAVESLEELVVGLRRELR